MTLAIQILVLVVLAALIPACFILGVRAALVRGWMWPYYLGTALSIAIFVVLMFLPHLFWGR